jgi:hypothetical protein
MGDWERADFWTPMNQRSGSSMEFARRRPSVTRHHYELPHLRRLAHLATTHHSLLTALSIPQKS